VKATISLTVHCCKCINYVHLQLQTTSSHSPVKKAFVPSSEGISFSVRTETA